MAKKGPAQEAPQPEGPGVVEQLQEAIRSSGRTQNQLSEECGIHRSALSRFMRGKQDLGIVTVEKLCRALGLELTARKGKKGKG